MALLDECDILKFHAVIQQLVGRCHPCMTHVCTLQSPDLYAAIVSDDGHLTEELLADQIIF